MAMSVRHSFVRRPQALLPLALLLAAACAGAGGAGAGRGAGRITPGAVSDGRLVPGRPAAATYGPQAGSCPSSGAISTAIEELTVAAQRAGRAAPELDPRACAVAETFLGWDTAAHGAPRLAVLQFVSSWFGLPTTVFAPTLASVGPLASDSSQARANDQQIAERIVEAAGEAVLGSARPLVGVAVDRTRRGRSDFFYRISVVVVDAPVELDPLPRRLDLGGKATLSGRLVGGPTNPKVLVSDATGRLSTPAQAPGEAFTAEVACGDRPGRIQIEIQAERQGSPTPVASFPVACGQEPPASVAVAPPPWPSDPAAAEARVLELVNEERAAAGLPPLVADPAIAEVAEGIAADLADRGGAPGGPSVVDRLKTQGIASPVVLQSAAAERSFERAHERLMASPANRANVMSAETTHAGVGSAVKKDAEGRPLVYVAEVFIRELPPVDVEQTRQALREAVARKRKDARTSALAPDPRLDQVAQEYAEAIAAAGGALPKEQHAALTSPLNRTFRTVTMVSGARQEFLDFAEEPQTTAPGKSLGVGVAAGKHPVLGRNATYVVLMVGTPRPGAPAANLPRKKPKR